MQNVTTISDSVWRELVVGVARFDRLASDWLLRQPPEARAAAILDMLLTDRKKITFIVGVVRLVERENAALRERIGNYAPVRLLN
jgi:hypothetical protein